MKQPEKDPRYKEMLERGYNVPKDGIYPVKPPPSPAPPAPKYGKRGEETKNER